MVSTANIIVQLLNIAEHEHNLWCLRVVIFLLHEFSSWVWKKKTPHIISMPLLEQVTACERLRGPHHLMVQTHLNPEVEGEDEAPARGT